MSFNDEYLKLRKKRLEEEEIRSNPTNQNPRYYVDTLFAKANSDIAPVRLTEQEQQIGTTDERKWFEKGAFEDGYQFGDLIKTIDSSAKDAETNVMAGILGIGEKVVDAGAYIVGGIGGLFSKDFQNDTKDFIAKDLYDEEEIARKIVTARSPVAWVNKDIMDEENSVLGEKTDALAQSGGQLLGTMALQSVGVPWYLTSGVTSFGAETENAFNQGATYGQAGLSAAITAGVELATEKLFGGSGLGEKGLINLDGLTKGISNKVGKALLDFGIDMTGEGVEEIASQIGSNFASALYSEKNLQELLLSEEAFDEYLESFIGGMALGGVANVGKVSNSIKTGRDYRSGLTENEQKVFDNVYNNRVAEAQEGGKELSKKEKDAIYDAVMKDLEKGRIDIDTIEEVLGGEEYETYKKSVEEKDALQKEYDEFRQMKKGDLTVEQDERYNEVKQKLAELKNSKASEQAKLKLSEAVQSRLMREVKGKKEVGDKYLAESYNEKARGQQKFETDLSQYDKKQQDHVKRALESGVLNNRNSAHDIVGLTAKIEADKGVRINYVNNKIIKDMGVYVEGVDNNGFVKDGVLYINVDSPKYLNFTVGHEITHTMKVDKKLYADMQRALFDVANSKGEYDSRLKKVTETYKKYDPKADPKEELTADLVGDYLFNDEDFVKRLSTEHRNVFQKVWDEIKHLWKMATAGSKEARELEKAMHLFEKVYRESGKAQTEVNTDDVSASDTKYSLTDSNGKQLTKGQQEYFKDSNQIKSVANEQPGKNADIRYSLSDSEGNPIDADRISFDESDTRYSLSHNSEIAKGQMAYIANHKVALSQEELAEAQKVTNAMVDVMMKYSSILPEDKIGKVLTKNGSYDRSVENTTICVRTLAYNEFVDKVQEEIGRPLTQMESFLVSQKLYDIAVDPQCLYCYVSLDRKAFNDMLLRYMQDRDTVIAKYNNSDKSDAAVSKLYEEFLNGRKDTKNMKDRFNKWLSYVDGGTQLLSLADIATEDRQSVIKANGGNLAAQLADARAYAQSASWSKIQKNYVAYRDEILKLGDRVVKNLNEHYGLRWYSFSDYSAAFIVENMQQITDASIRGLKGLSYTKDTDYAEIFAPSGMNINVSVFVNQDANGNFFIDEKQSANFEKALELRERYPNVGIVATVTNDDALRWAASQEWSDVIIPFHIVRTGADVAEYYKWLNYTAESADSVKDSDLWNAYLDSLNLSDGARKKASKNIYPNEHKNDKNTYLNLCESRGLTPRFARFAGEDWYMKLVNETRLSADVSTPLKPNYNLEAAQASFQKFVEKGGYEGGWYKKAINVDAEAKAVAQDVLAGKKANEVDYGRQDAFVPEDLIAGRKTNRTHGIRYSLTEYTAEEKKAHNDAVLEHFGKTYKWAETGYLLLDGSKLDLSGKHDGAPGGYRTVDHRDITEALGYDYGGGDYSGSLVQFMSEGNIRIVPEMNGINLSVKPTKAQEQALSDYISRARGEVVLDIDDLNGYTVVSVEYPRGTYYTKVLNDIREWFDNGKQPETSGLSAFRSLTKKGAPQKRYGNYNISGKDVRYEAPMQEEVAPTQETVSKTETVDTPKPNLPITDIDYAPVKERYEAIKPERKKNTEPRLKRVTDADNIAPTENKTAEIYDTEPETGKKKSRGWARFRANFLDKQSVFEDLALKTNNRELMGKANYILSAEQRAQRLIGKGKSSAGVKSLNDIRAEVESTGKTKQFYEYLYHRHNIDRMSLEESKPVFGDSVTADVSRAEVAKYEAANPKFTEYAQDVYDYMNYLRDQMVESGVISQETADLWAKMYPHYVPIRRLGDTGLNINVPLDTGRTGVNAPIKKATGGSRDILPLFDTMALRTEQTYKAIAKNNFGVELKNTLGSTIESAEANLDEMIDSVDAHEDLLKKGEKGKNPTFTVFEDGKKVTFEITEDMYDALKPTSDDLRYTNKVANTIGNIHRGLLTEYNPTFMLTNAIKDAQDILINSQHPAKTYANLPNAIAQMAKNGTWYQEYLENGGESNTYFDGQSNTFTKDDTGIKKIIGMPLRAISAVNNYVERAPRLAEYIASRKAGASAEVAMLDAARVTTNFAAGGDVTKFANRNGFTFLNASVQGAMQQVRNVREAKANGLKGWVQLATKVAIAGIPAMILNNLLWDDDEEYEQLSDYVKDNYYVVAKFGDGQFVRIPKGRAMAVIQDALEQVGNALTGDDEVDLANFLELAISNLAPNNPLDNNILAPIGQVLSNKTWYGDDLVPTRLQDLPAAEQFDESTDSISKWLGEKLNISPYKLNYLLNQYSGGIGDVALPMLTPEAESGDNSLAGNLLAPMRDKFTTDRVMNNQNVSDFYDTVDKLTANAKSSYATDEDILKYKYMNSVNAELSELYKQKREIQNSNLADAKKYEAVRDIQKQIDTLAEESLNTYGSVNIDGGYAAVGDRYYKLNDDGEWVKITDKQLEKQEEVTSGLGIDPSTYWENKSEYDFAYEYPEKYAVAKSVGGYEKYKTYQSEMYDIKADKDENGKSITGSRKDKVADYINGLDIPYEEKIILFKSEYNADDTYNYEIIDYLNNRNDISYDEMVAILRELGFTVKGYTITWD